MTNSGENPRILVQKLVAMTDHPRYIGDTKPGPQYWLPQKSLKRSVDGERIVGDGFLGEVNHYPQKSEVSAILREVKNGELNGFSILFRIRTHGEIHRIAKLMSDRRSQFVDRVTFSGHQLLEGDEARQSLDLLKRFISEGQRYTATHRRTK